jgi:hypothetical protein
MIKDQLKEDLKTALKAGDSIRRSTIGMILAALKNRELEKRGRLMKGGADASSIEVASELSDEEAIEVIGSEMKKRKEAIATYEQAGRSELAAGERAEYDILMGYMPQQMTVDEIRALIKETMAHVQPAGMKDMGKVLASLMPKVKGKADGQIVSELVKEELAMLS